MESQNENKESKHEKMDFDWFDSNGEIGKEFDKFCKQWWGEKGKDKEPKEEDWISYSPHEEWKRLQLEKENPYKGENDCIGEYELMIDENDLGYMFDCVLDKDEKHFMESGYDGSDAKKFEMVETPSERAEKLDKEFDDWAKEKGFVNTSEREEVFLPRN